MTIHIKYKKEELDLYVEDSMKVSEVISSARRFFCLSSRGNYALSKKNHVIVEFCKTSTLKECNVKDEDKLIFVNYSE